MKFVFWEWLRALPKPERFLVIIFAAALVLSFLALLFNTYLQKTVEAPAFGGNVTVGFVGTPHYINPVIAPANDVDKALVKVVYPSLLRYNEEGKLIPWLAETYAIGDNGKIYEFFLRKGAQWDDGTPITAHDVVYTIHTIQDPKTTSPLARLWEGVKVQAIDDTTVRFTLPEPYAFFLQNVTGGILPRHIWETVSAENFALSEYNKQPIGAGPYRFTTFAKSDSTITSITFDANPDFFGPQPYIPRLEARFYSTPDALLKAYARKEVHVAGISAISLDPSMRLDGDSRKTPFSLPRYFAVFLNDAQNASLRKKEVREALLVGIDRHAIIASTLGDQGEVVDSPIPPVLSAYYASGTPSHPFDAKRAQELLTAGGFTPQKPLKIELTVVNDESLQNIAQMVVANWRAIGIDVTIKTIEIGQLRDEVLQRRSYQAFLFGQALALEPDPFSLWHSSQSEYPGLNLTSYKNRELDSILEELRKTFDEARKKELFAKFQSIISQDVPALFLYSPRYVVLSHATIRGIQSVPLSLPEDYLDYVGNWYIYTKRVSK